MGTLGVRIESCLPPALLPGFPGRLTSPFQSLLSRGYNFQNHRVVPNTRVRARAIIRVRVLVRLGLGLVLGIGLGLGLGLRLR